MSWQAPQSLDTKATDDVLYCDCDTRWTLLHWAAAHFHDNFISHLETRPGYNNTKCMTMMTKLKKNKKKWPVIALFPHRIRLYLRWLGVCRHLFMVHLKTERKRVMTSRHVYQEPVFFGAVPNWVSPEVPLRFWTNGTAVGIFYLYVHLAVTQLWHRRRQQVMMPHRFTVFVNRSAVRRVWLPKQSG